MRTAQAALEAATSQGSTAQSRLVRVTLQNHIKKAELAVANERQQRATALTAGCSRFDLCSQLLAGHNAIQNSKFHWRRLHPDVAPAAHWNVWRRARDDREHNIDSVKADNTNVFFAKNCSLRSSEQKIRHNINRANTPRAQSGSSTSLSIVNSSGLVQTMSSEARQVESAILPHSTCSNTVRECSSAGSSKCELSTRKKIHSRSGVENSNSKSANSSTVPTTSGRALSLERNAYGRAPINDATNKAQPEPASASAHPRFRAAAQRQYDENIKFCDHTYTTSFDWRPMRWPHGRAEYDEYELRQLEISAASDDTAFGRALARHLVQRGAEQIMRSGLKLINILADLREDSNMERGAYTFINMSRGLDAMGDSSTERPPDSITANYSSATVDFPDKVQKAIDRFASLGFCMRWTDIQKKYKITRARPRIIHALGAVERKGKVRPIVDGSMGQVEGKDFNSCSDYEGDCCFATLALARRSMSARGGSWRGDFQDAFLQSALCVKSIEEAGFVWTDQRTGVTHDWAWTRLIFGFKVGPWWQHDCIGTALGRKLVTSLESSGLRCLAMPQYGKFLPVSRPPVTGHALTAAPLLIDDWAGFTTTSSSGVYSFLRFTFLCLRWGLTLADDIAKTAMWARQMPYIGYFLNHVTMKFSFEPQRIIDSELMLTRALEPDYTFGELESLTSTMVFLANVFRAARPAYRKLMDVKNHVLNLLMAKNPANKRRSPRMKATLVASYIKNAGAYPDIAVWLRIVKSCNCNAVITDVRLQLAKIEIYTDSSFYGGGFAVTCGWFVGFPWPSSWRERIGNDSRISDIFICFLELLSCAMSVRIVANFCPGMLIRLWCDNLSVVQMIRKCATRSAECTKIMAELQWLLATFGCELQCKHISSGANYIGDGLSRLHEPGFTRIHSRVNFWSGCTVTLNTAAVSKTYPRFSGTVSRDYQCNRSSRH